MVQLLAERVVLLVTARDVGYLTVTRDRLRRDLGGWQPAGAYFRTTDERPPRFKARTFVEAISSDWGSDPSRYLALESNAATRRAYARLGVRGVRVPEEPPADLMDGDLWRIAHAWSR